MKKVKGTFLILLIILISCNESIEEEPTPEERRTELYKHVSNMYSHDDEKVVILSIINDIKAETYRQILIEHQAESILQRDSSLNTKRRIIEKISEKHKLTLRRVAALIYSYEYEALTREDIFNEEYEWRQEELAAEAAAEQEADQDF